MIFLLSYPFLFPTTNDDDGCLPPSYKKTPPTKILHFLQEEKKILKTHWFKALNVNEKLKNPSELLYKMTNDETGSENKKVRQST